MAKAASKSKQEFRTAADNLADAVIKGLQEKKGKEIVMLDLHSRSFSVRMSKARSAIDSGT